ITIKPGSRTRYLGGGPAQAKGVTGCQSRIGATNQTPASASGQFHECRPDPSHSGRASEDLESLTEIVTAFIVVDGLQRGQLPDAGGVTEQRLVIEAPGPATGQEVGHLRSCRCQVPVPPKRVGCRQDS